MREVLDPAIILTPRNKANLAKVKKILKAGAKSNPSAPHLRWRNSAELRGVRARIVAALAANKDGSTAQIELKTLINCVEICDQAIHTEVNHEPPEDSNA